MIPNQVAGFSLSVVSAGQSGVIALPAENVLARHLLASSGGTMLLSGFTGVVGIGVPGTAPIFIPGAAPLYITGGGATVSVQLLSYITQGLGQTLNAGKYG